MTQENEVIYLYVKDLIRRQTVKEFDNILHFDEVFTKCDEALKWVLDRFPTEITDKLNEAEMLSLYVTRREQYTERRVVNKSVDLKQVKPKELSKDEFVQHVCYKYMLDQKDMDYRTCAAFIAGRMWSIRKESGAVTHVSNGHIRHEFDSYFNSHPCYHKRVSECIRDASLELTAWCIKNNIDLDTWFITGTIYKMLDLYINDLIQKDKINWYKPDLWFARQVLVNGTFPTNYKLLTSETAKCITEIADIYRLHFYGFVQSESNKDLLRDKGYRGSKYENIILMLELLTNQHVAKSVIEHDAHLEKVAVFIHYYVTNPNYVDNYYKDTTKFRL